MANNEINTQRVGTKEVRTYQMSFMAIAVIVGISGILGGLLDSTGKGAFEQPANAAPAITTTAVVKAAPGK